MNKRKKVLNTDEQYWSRTKFNEWNNKWLERKAEEMIEEEKYLERKRIKNDEKRKEMVHCERKIYKRPKKHLQTRGVCGCKNLQIPSFYTDVGTKCL